MNKSHFRTTRAGIWFPSESRNRSESFPHACFLPLDISRAGCAGQNNVNPNVKPSFLRCRFFVTSIVTPHSTLPCWPFALPCCCNDCHDGTMIIWDNIATLDPESTSEYMTYKFIYSLTLQIICIINYYSQFLKMSLFHYNTHYFSLDKMCVILVSLRVFRYLL